MENLDKEVVHEQQIRELQKKIEKLDKSEDDGQQQDVKPHVWHTKNDQK